MNEPNVPRLQLFQQTLNLSFELAWCLKFFCVQYHYKDFIPPTRSTTPTHLDHTPTQMVKMEFLPGRSSLQIWWNDCSRYCATSMYCLVCPVSSGCPVFKTWLKWTPIWLMGWLNAKLIITSIRFVDSSIWTFIDKMNIQAYINPFVGVFFQEQT